ncbi:MAG: bacillithiol system redox-active protein YtxJ [Chitinophagaceae bacterium]
MEWIKLTSEEGINTIIEKSKEQPQVIFKHSTRCSISSVALQRVERAKQPEGIDFYFLDLLAYRTLSSKVESAFNVPHESPQVLVIKDGKCVYTDSHMGISMNDIEAEAKMA